MKQKPGYKTTEFWLTFAALVVGLLIASGVLDEGGEALKVAAFVSSALASLGYSFSRGKTKTASAIVELNKDAKTPH